MILTRLSSTNPNVIAHQLVKLWEKERSKMRNQYSCEIDECASCKLDPTYCPTCDKPLEAHENGDNFIIACRWAIIIAICFGIAFLLYGCGGGGNTPYQPVSYTAPVSAVTIKGDSMADGYSSAGATDYWSQWGVTVENDGILGVDLNYLINNTSEHRSLNTVAIWAGYNTLKHPEITVETAIAEYSQYINKLTFTKLICVGVPYNTTMDNSRVDAFNAGIKTLCPNFVDTKDIPVFDGVHPTQCGYTEVGKRIEKLL